MPCAAAMIKDFSTITPEASVQDALSLLKKKKAKFLAVVDESGRLLGVFSYLALFRSLLPISVPVGENQQADMIIGAAPGIAKRLIKSRGITVSQVMNRNYKAVHPETPFWQGLKALSESPGPVFITESETGKVLGLMNDESAMHELERLEKSGA